MIYYGKYFIFLFNILMININIYFLVKKNNIKIILKLKNVDLFSLLIVKAPYTIISNYLNKKYISSFNKKDSFRQNKKIITVDCIDFLFNSKNCIDYLNSIFNKEYIFKIDFDNPEYILYDVFGCQHIKEKYKNSIKIAYYSENKIPDFDEADYALSQAHFVYFDRYFKYPSFIWNFNRFRNFNFGKIRKKVLKKPIRTKFCAAVISNNATFSHFRLDFIKELSKYKKIDMGGNAYKLYNFFIQIIFCNQLSGRSGRTFMTNNKWEAKVKEVHLLES